MDLMHLPLASLTIAQSNMRHSKKNPDISDILPSIRARGVLQPLLVRPLGGLHEVVAGRRRLFAERAVAKESGLERDVPCIIMQADDDAAAIEASLIENVARQDADLMTQFVTYTRLVKEGRTISEIAGTFAKTEREVEQCLALGNLIPGIRDLYTADEIEDQTVQALTLAKPAKQKEWLALYKKGSAPHGRRIKAWICGGATIPVSSALFAEADYTGPILTDLFDEGRFFGDTDLFWELQNTALAARRDQLLAKGWKTVEILNPGERWDSWKYVKTSKKAGGTFFIEVGHDGSTRDREGYLTEIQAKRIAKAASVGDAAPSSTSSKPEVTQAQNNYIEGHRLAATRAALVENPDTALRLLLAHCISSSSGVRVTAHHNQALGSEIADSIEAQAPHKTFEDGRKTALDLLGFAGNRTNTVTGRHDKVVPTFAALLQCDSHQLLQIAAAIMAEALEPGSDAGEAAARELGVDLATTWSADDAFFTSLRDKEVIHAMLTEAAGKAVADANLTETGKVKKQILRDCLDGTNGREKVSWLPRWLRPTIATYTDRGGVRLAEERCSVEFDDDIEDEIQDEDQYLAA